MSPQKVSSLWTLVAVAPLLVTLAAGGMGTPASLAAPQQNSMQLFHVNEAGAWEPNRAYVWKLSQSKDQDNSAVKGSPQEKLELFFSYYLRGGGVWRQDSDAAAGDQGAPVAYIKKYAWGPGRAMVIDDTYALMRNGSCTPFVHIVHVWDHKGKATRAHIFHSAGFFLTAEAKRLDETLTEAELSGVLPNGTEVRMRDRTDTSDPDRAVVTASAWDGKEWTPGRTVSWVRISNESNPCRLPTQD